MFDVDLLDIGAKPETPTPHRHEYYEIFWVLQGKGSQSIDFEEYLMEPGRMFFITPGQIHDVHVLPDKLYAISFKAEFIKSESQIQSSINKLFVHNFSDQPYIEISDQGQTDLLKIIDVIDAELTSDTANQDLLSTLMAVFIQYVTRFVSGGGDSEGKSSDDRMLKLLTLVDQYYHVRKDAGFYSDKLSITSKRLNELARERFSKTITQMIHDRVIVEACRELAFSHKTVKTIAFGLGYKDVSYFCRFYKRVTGKSPQEFRQDWEG